MYLYNLNYNKFHYRTTTNVFKYIYKIENKKNIKK